MEEDLKDDQKDILRRLRQSRGQCPTAEALIEYAAMEEASCHSHRAHEHVQICARCQLVLHKLKDPEPSE
jgi:hypothetical protein